MMTQDRVATVGEDQFCDSIRRRLPVKSSQTHVQAPSQRFMLGRAHCAAS